MESKKNSEGGTNWYNQIKKLISVDQYTWTYTGPTYHCARKKCLPLHTSNWSIVRGRLKEHGLSYQNANKQ